MSKETPTLVATKRDRLGSRYAKRLRAAGQLPANLYGHGSEPMAIAVSERDALCSIDERAVDPAEPVSAMRRQAIAAFGCKHSEDVP